MTLIMCAGRAIVPAIFLGCIFPCGSHAQQQDKPPLTIEERVGMEIGPSIVRAAVLAVRVDAMEKQIADLKKQNAELLERLGKLEGGQPTPGSLRPQAPPN